MIKGKRIYLRPLKQQDLETVIDHLNNFECLGDYLPLRIFSIVEFNRRFNENGHWTEENGFLLICENETGRMLGHINYFKIAHYMPGLEIGYRIFSSNDRGKGFCSEALEILTEWLFAGKQLSRIQVCMDTRNIGSRRVAEKCGYIYEGTMRMSMYSRGKYVDLDMLSTTRPEFEKRMAL